MNEHTQSAHPIAQLFAQSVVEGSARYWAAHFSNKSKQPAVQAAFCFAHLMDQLTSVSPDVIAEKSVWWHDELTNCSDTGGRHPITQALLQTSHHDDASLSADATNNAALVDAMHRHLHGALMSQQQTALNSEEAWTQYAELRFGSLHELIGIASGMPPKNAALAGPWTARLHALGVLRAPDYYNDARILKPAPDLMASLASSLPDKLQILDTDQPAAAAANRVLIHHERRWWQSKPSAASPVFTGLPTGLRGMLASWREARKASSY